MLKELLKKRLGNEKGMTLVELLAVIVILAIVAAIAIPSIGNIINNSRDKAQLSDAANIIAAAKIAYTEGACVDNTCSQSELINYVDGVTLATGNQVVYTPATTGSSATPPKWTITRSLEQSLNQSRYTTDATGYDYTAATTNANAKIVADESVINALLED